MRVLLVRPTAGGGLAAHVDHEHALLAAAGHDVAEAPVQIGPRPRPGADLRTVRTLRRLLADAPAPLTLHAHGLRAGALSALARPRRGGHRLVVTLHNRTVGGTATRVLGELLLRVLARGADTVLAVSPDLAASARRAGARDVRHAVVPAPRRPDTPGGSGSARGAEAPGEDAPDTGDPGADGPGLEVLVLARLAPQKGLHDLLDAAALLPPGTARIRVAGDGPLRGELEARIRAEHLPVVLLGRREDVPALLAGADLQVSAARWEGQPVSLQEGLLAGRAIVATDAGGTRWVTGGAAALVPVGDPAALAAAILAHTDPAVRAAAEAASRRRAAALPADRDLLDQLQEVLAPGNR